MVKVRVIDFHPLLANSVGDEAILTSDSAEYFRNAGVIEIIEPVREIESSAKKPKETATIKKGK